MPRRPTIRNSIYPYHVVARTHNRVWFNLPLSEMWEIYLELLEFVEKECGIRVHAFVLMSNHFHLMIKTPKANIDEVMYWIMKKSTLEVQKRSGVINSIYGGRYKSSLLKEPEYIANSYKYILQNPVRANLVKKVEDYPYSICREFGNTGGFKFKVSEPEYVRRVLCFDSNLTLKWLNQKYSKLEAISIKHGHEKPEFKFPKNDNTKKFIKPTIEHPNVVEFEEKWNVFMAENEGRNFKNSNQLRFSL